MHRLASHLNLREPRVVVGAVRPVQIHNDVVVAASGPRRSRLDVRNVHAMLIERLEHLLLLGDFFLHGEHETHRV